MSFSRIALLKWCLAFVALSSFVACGSNGEDSDLKAKPPGVGVKEGTFFLTQLKEQDFAMEIINERCDFENRQEARIYTGIMFGEYAFIMENCAGNARFVLVGHKTKPDYATIVKMYPQVKVGGGTGNAGIWQYSHGLGRPTTPPKSCSYNDCMTQ